MVRFLTIVLFLVSCEDAHRYTSKEIASIQITKNNLIGDRPSLASEPFLVSEAIENKLIDTPIRIIGDVDEVNKSTFLLEEGGEELLVETNHDIHSISLASKSALIEGTLFLRGGEFSFKANTVLILK